MWSKRVCFGFGARHACLRGGNSVRVVVQLICGVFLIIDERDRMANKYKQSDKNVAIIKKYAGIYDFNILEFHCLLLKMG